MCLEIVSGRKCLDNTGPPEQAILTTWAQERHSKGSIMDIVDPKMELRSDEILEVQRVLNTALLCLQHREDRRPDMAHAVSMLQGGLGSEVMNLGTDSERSLGSINFDASSSMEMSLLGLRSTSTDQDVLKSERLPSRSQGSPTVRNLKRSSSLQIKVA